MTADGDVPAVKRHAFLQRCAENSAAAGTGSNGSGNSSRPGTLRGKQQGQQQQLAAGWRRGWGPQGRWKKAGGNRGGGEALGRAAASRETSPEDEEVRGGEGRG